MASAYNPNIQEPEDRDQQFKATIGNILNWRSAELYDHTLFQNRQTTYTLANHDLRNEKARYMNFKSVKVEPGVMTFRKEQWPAMVLYVFNSNTGKEKAGPPGL